MIFFNFISDVREQLSFTARKINLVCEWFDIENWGCIVERSMQMLCTDISSTTHLVKASICVKLWINYTGLGKPQIFELYWWWKSLFFRFLFLNFTSLYLKHFIVFILNVEERKKGANKNIIEMPKICTGLNLYQWQWGDHPKWFMMQTASRKEFRTKFWPYSSNQTSLLLLTLRILYVQFFNCFALDLMERGHINLSLCTALLKSAGLWDQDLAWRDLFLTQGTLSPCGMSEIGMRLKRTSWASHIPKAVHLALVWEISEVHSINQSLVPLFVSLEEMGWNSSLVQRRIIHKH